MPGNGSWTPFGPDRPSTGRAKGSRNRLNKQFFQRLSEDFDEHGEAAIARMRFTDPAAYIAVIAKLMPQRLEIETPTDGMSLDRLERMIELAERMQALNGTLPDVDATSMRAIGPSVLTHEKPPSALVLIEGGGGPAGEEPQRGINLAPSTLSVPTEDGSSAKPAFPAGRPPLSDLLITDATASCYPADDPEEPVDPASLF